MGSKPGWQNLDLVDLVDTNRSSFIRHESLKHSFLFNIFGSFPRNILRKVLHSIILRYLFTPYTAKTKMLLLLKKSFAGKWPRYSPRTISYALSQTISCGMSHTKHKRNPFRICWAMREMSQGEVATKRLQKVSKAISAKWLFLLPDNIAVKGQSILIEKKLFAFALRGKRQFFTFELRFRNTFPRK